MRRTLTERALVARINRALKATNEQLRRPRAACVRESVGDLVVWNWARNLPGECHVDVEDLGRRLGVLADHEAVVEVPT